MGDTRDEQLALMTRYDFREMPPEVLGGVYEELIEPSAQRMHGAFYTPSHLVDAALDEAMPPTPALASSRVLDPACGSGLFLARAYERLLDAKEDQVGRSLLPAEMAEVLRRQVFGSDLMEGALRIAALSCYLVLLDRLPAGSPATVKLPRLVGVSLQAGDYFSVRRPRDRFEVIASNPPWAQATDSASQFLEEGRYPASSTLALAQAFFWGCAEQLKPAGRMAMLMPARSLYNRRGKEAEFQQRSLADDRLRTLIDFSAFRHTLFADATAPCALYVLSGESGPKNGHVTFAAPKPSPVSLSTGRIVIEAENLVRVPRSRLSRSGSVLRTLLFGDMQDVQLMERLTFGRATLGGLGSEGWTLGVGYQAEQRSIAGRSDPTLSSRPLVEPRSISPFVAHSSGRVGRERFHRPRDPRLYGGRAVLIARAVLSDGRIRAAFHGAPVGYSESIFGLVMPESLGSEHGHALATYLNSSLVRYFLFMSASSWGVERPELKPQDLKSIPLPESLLQGDLCARLAKISEDVGREALTVADAVDAADEALAFEFGLTERERVVLADRLSNRLRSYLHPGWSGPYDAPSSEMVDGYCRSVERLLGDGLGMPVRAAPPTTADNGDVLIVLFVGEQAGGGPIPPAVPRIDGFQGTIVVRRNQRSYGRTWLQLRKRAEVREFSRAAAFSDVDEIIGETLAAASRLRESD
jgi:SAM-dependent methyltransferase